MLPGCIACNEGLMSRVFTHNLCHPRCNQPAATAPESSPAPGSADERPLWQRPSFEVLCCRAQGCRPGRTTAHLILRRAIPRCADGSGPLRLPSTPRPATLSRPLALADLSASPLQCRLEERREDRAGHRSLQLKTLVKDSAIDFRRSWTEKPVALALRLQELQELQLAA